MNYNFYEDSGPFCQVFRVITKDNNLISRLYWFLNKKILTNVIIPKRKEIKTLAVHIRNDHTIQNPIDIIINRNVSYAANKLRTKVGNYLITE